MIVNVYFFQGWMLQSNLLKNVGICNKAFLLCLTEKILDFKFFTVNINISHNLNFNQKRRLEIITVKIIIIVIVTIITVMMIIYYSKKLSFTVSD